jgi:hypothetical protein
MSIQFLNSHIEAKYCQPTNLVTAAIISLCRASDSLGACGPQRRDARLEGYTAATLSLGGRYCPGTFLHHTNTKTQCPDTLRRYAGDDQLPALFGKYNARQPIEAASKK